MISSHRLKPLKFYSDLHDAKSRREHGMFLVEGYRFVEQIILNRPDALDEILLREDVVDELKSWIRDGYPVRVLDRRQYAEISPNKTSQPVAAVAKIPEDLETEILPHSKKSKILLLEDVQDPGNVGTLLRSAAAFGFGAAILSDKCADPFGPRAVAACAGAVFSLKLRRSKNWITLIDKCKSSGLSLFLADIEGRDIRTLSQDSGFILALGNEGSGFSDELRERATETITIPFNSTGVESLNVAAAGAICMWTLSQGKSHELSGHQQPRKG